MRWSVLLRQLRPFSKAIESVHHHNHNMRSAFSAVYVAAQTVLSCTNHSRRSHGPWQVAGHATGGLVLSMIVYMLRTIYIYIRARQSGRACRPGSVVSIVRGTGMMAALGAMAGRGPAPSHHKHKAVGRPSRGGPPDRDTYTLSRGRQLQKDGDLGTTDDQNCTAATAGARHPSIDEPSAADRAGGQCASSASGPEHRDWCGRRRPYRAGRDLDGSRPATGRPVLRKLLLGEEIGEHAAVPTC